MFFDTNESCFISRDQVFVRLLIMCRVALVEHAQTHIQVALSPKKLVFYFDFQSLFSHSKTVRSVLISSSS